MARRNLRYEAQVQAAAQFAPQAAALSEALQQAKADRDSAIHTAAATSKGIGRAINRAGPSVKRAYSGAVGLGAPSQEFKSDAYRQSAANERAVTGTALASSLGNALKELSDRRIEAAAGRAYRTQAALGQYAGDVAKVQSKRQSLAAQEGLLAASNFSKLTESAAGRKQQRILQSQRLRSQAELQGERLASQEAVAGARLRSSEHQSALGRRQQKLGRLNQRSLQSQRLAAADRKDGGAGSSGPKPTSAHVFKGRQSIQLLHDEYKSGRKMSEVAAEAREKGYPEAMIVAAANLATKGYVAPREVRALRSLGYDLPKEWTPQVVKPYVRKRRGK